MKTIIALHGNPGSPSDFSRVQDLLDKASFQILSESPDSDTWIAKLTQTSDRKIIVAHSWGAYAVLKKAKAYQQYIQKIILVCPYLVPEKEISPVAAALIRLPLLGNLLLKKSHASSIDGFISDMLSPNTEVEASLVNTLGNNLSDWKLWAKAAFNKIEMQNSPLVDSDIPKNLDIEVLWGDEDKVSTVTQLNTLIALGIQKISKVAHTGHGLIWSHPGLVLDLITSAGISSAEKIGYYSGSHVRNNVISYLEKHLQDHPEKVALKWAKPESLKSWMNDQTQYLEHDSINYQHLALRINSFARGLLDIGIQKGDRVIIFLPMSLDMYVAMFAVQRIGAIAVFLDSWARSHHLGASAECVSPKAMISFDMAFKLVDQVPEFNSMPIRILYGPGEKFTHKFTDLLKTGEAPIAAVEQEETALITFTTGSTGKPKGANRTHRFLAAQHNALTHVIPYLENDLDMPAFPIFSLNNLATGLTTILPAVNLAAPADSDSALLVSQILGQKLTCTTLSPSMLVGVARFCKEKGIILSSLRRVVTGGAPISKDDVQLFYSISPQTEIWILYGSTEAEPMAHIEGRSMLVEKFNTDPEILEEGVNVGHISEDVDYKFIKVFDGPVSLKNGNWSEIEVPTGGIGEFICTGDHVCKEYYNNEEAFVKTKIVGEDGRVWHRTGDMGYIDDQKNLWLVGRVNNAIHRKGQYYFPVRAEVLLKRLSFTYRCGFVGLADSELGEKTVAAIELKEDIEVSSFDFNSAKMEIQRIFEKNSLPLDDIKFMKRIPMDPRHHSKVEYALLKNLLQDAGEILG